MTISAVGSTLTDSGFGDFTIGLTPTNVGDIYVMGVYANSTIPECTGISGGGVTTWHQIVRNNNSVVDIELWWGVLTSTGSLTATATFSGSSGFTAFAAQEFGTGGLPSWSVDVSGLANGSGSDFVTHLPSLTPAGANELYVGASFGASYSGSGLPSGYTLAGDGAPYYIYNPDCSGSEQEPSYDCFAGSPWSSLGVLLIAGAAPPSTPKSFAGHIGHA